MALIIVHLGRVEHATRFDSFDLLYAGRGLPSEEVAEVLAFAAERAIMMRPRPAPARPSQ